MIPLRLDDGANKEEHMLFALGHTAVAAPASENRIA